MKVKDSDDVQEIAPLADERLSDVIYPQALAEYEREGVVLVNAEVAESWKAKEYLRPYGACPAIRFEPAGIPKEDLAFALHLVQGALVDGGALYIPVKDVPAIPIQASSVSNVDGFRKFIK